MHIGKWGNWHPDTDRLAPVSSCEFSLHKEALFTCLMAVLSAHMALWLLPSEAPGASWIRSFSLHHCPFFVQWVAGRKHWWIFWGSCDLSEQGFLQYPKDIGIQICPPTLLPWSKGPIFVHTGSWEAGSSLALGFSALQLICPQVNSNKGKITYENFVFEWGWEGGNIRACPIIPSAWAVERLVRDGVIHPLWVRQLELSCSVSDSTTIFPS
jgi:hypothetical protein